MPLGSYAWGVILPVEKVNNVTNPSFELGTAGWGTIAGGTIGTTSAGQAFGAWAGSFAPTSNGTSGVFGGAWTAANGSAYTVSAYVRGAAGIPYRLAAGDSNGVNFVGSTTFTGGGTWQRYNFSFTEATGATRTVVLTKAASANTGAVYLDGVQVELGSLTTYIDGDQDGCNWQGARHAASSYRPGQLRSGGSIVALVDLGFSVNDSMGIGMPPVENNAQSYALLDGAQFQRQRAAARTFTLTSDISGATREDLHTLRRQFINAVKIDATTPQQPARFVYIGAAGTATIDAVYQSGLEFGEPAGFNESVAVQFVAHDPYWRAELDSGTALPAFTNIGSANFLVYKDRNGQWGTLGATFNSVASPANPVQQMEWAPSGTLWMVGTFTQCAGTTASNMAFYTPSNGRFGTIVATTNLIAAMALLPNENIYLAGTFGGVSGTATQNIGYYVKGATAIGTLTGGTPNGYVRALKYDSGTLYAGGQFILVAGTTAPLAAFYVNGAWGTFSGGTLGGQPQGDFVSTLARSATGTVYVGGRIGTVAGTVARSFAFHNGAGWGTVLGVEQGGTIVYDMAFGQDGRLYLAGDFGSAGGRNAPNAAIYNGVALGPISSGIPRAGTAYARAITALPDGRIFWGGSFQGTAGGMPLTDSIAVWNGYTFLPLDIDLPGAAAMSCVRVLPNGTMYVAYNTSGTANAAAVAAIVNGGMAQAYPVVSIRNTGTANANIYELVNNTTGDALYFGLAVLGGETVTLNLTPGSRSFTSDYRGNLLSSILNGSNLATWRLLPGTNYVSFFASSGSIVASLSYRPRHWSADGGTIG